MSHRALTPVLTGVLFLLLAMAWNHATGTAFAASVAAAPQAGGSCPLTAAQQTKSSQAWLKMMPVFRHPRCTNCHGGIPDPFPDSVFVITAYELRGKPLAAYRRRRKRKQTHD